MIRDRKSLCVSQQILLRSIMVTALASGICAYAQAGQGKSPTGRFDQQQAQQQDQQERYQQQQLALQQNDVTQRSFALQELPAEMWQMEIELLRLKALLQANFRQHYAMIRKDADELVQLTSGMQADFESNGDQALPHEMVDRTTRMQKLAHEILNNMAGKKLPKPKPAPSTTSSTGGVGIGIADHRQRLKDKASDAKNTASTLKKAVDDYLASNNEQAVSVGALKAAASDRDHFDPNSVAIIKATVKLQQLADEIRTEMRLVNALR